MKNGVNGWPSEARHCLRLGAMVDKAIVETAAENFDVLVVQANLAASAPKGLASWAALDKPFWIDPIAYAFSANPAYLMSKQKMKSTGTTKTDFKRSFKTLAERYGAPFDRVISGVRSLTPEDFLPVDDKASCERVLSWQQHVLETTGSDTKYGALDHLEPALLTVPYFPLRTFDTNGHLKWLDVNIRLAEASDGFDAERLAVGLLVEGDVFDDDRFETAVLERYLGLAARHIWLWVSDNNEVTMTKSRAKRLIRTVKQIENAGKKAHLAFCGSFSSMLLARGAQSVSHGVGYWEQKDWEPIAGGGRPTLRYFFPPLRQRLSFLDADSILEVENVEGFHDTICGCATCRQTLADDLSNFGAFGRVEVRTRIDKWDNVVEYDVPTSDSLRLTKLHYLQAKGIEVKRAIAGDLSAQTLRDDASIHENQSVVKVSYLSSWADALDEVPHGD